MVDSISAKRRWPAQCLVAMGLLVGAGGLALGTIRWLDLSAVPTASISGNQRPEGMRLIPGGRFIMGSSQSVSAAERPAHEVVVRSFWIDAHSVTYDQFAKFVEKTGYITTAQQVGYAMVFDEASGGWTRRKGANWQHPDGPAVDSEIITGGNYPVVQVSWHDCVAYARWAGKRLPTEAEWERAARGGLADADFPWGAGEPTSQQPMANYRQIAKDRRDNGDDGFIGLAPVGAFPPSQLGLSDMAGNIWHWCADWYAEDYYALHIAAQPTGPSHGQSKVVRGGCWLDSSANLKVWARGYQRPDVGYQHVGFRCVKDLVDSPQTK